MKISVLMLTHNVLSYVYHSIMDVNKTKKENPDLELIVLDNDSKFKSIQINR